MGTAKPDAGPRRVVHCKRAPYDVYIGRPGPWGNPFAIGCDPFTATTMLAMVTGRMDAWFDGPLGRAKVIESYRAWLMAQPALVERAKAELRSKTLGCWCAPEPCHGDVLAEVANAD